MSRVPELVQFLDQQRRHVGVTKEKLASNAGYNRKQWSDIVNGTVNPSADCLADFAQVLGFKLMLWRDGVKK